MHDLATAEDIAGTVLEVTEGHGGGRIVRVFVELGPRSHLDPDRLSEAFRLATAGTPAESAILEVMKPPATWQCRTCGTTFTDKCWPTTCKCGSTDVSSDDPDGVTITAIDVDDGR